MYELKPRAVFAHKRVFDNPRAVARMERMLEALGIPQDAVPVITENDMERIAETAGATDPVVSQDILKGGHGRVRQGRLRQMDDPVIVFNTFVWDKARRSPVTKKFAHPIAARTYRMLCGVGEEFAFSKRDLFCGVAPKGYVCQGGDGAHTLSGCVHKCDYCGNGQIVTMQLDLEDFCGALERHFAEKPDQKLYRWDLYSDTVCFEPEYGGTEVVGGCFNRTEDKCLLLYTRSDNIDHLFRFPYQKHVLANWTLSTDTVCRVIERDTPSLEERIEAMRRAQEHGYTVRAGFTPIIPVRNWREEATRMLELLFSRVKPEVLRLWVVSMMEPEEFMAMFDEALIDPQAWQRMSEEAPTMRGQHHAPFPLDVRTEIYEHYLDEIRRISPQTPVALCTELPSAWKRLQHKVPMVPNNMFCCCGGLSVPGAWRGPLS